MSISAVLFDLDETLFDRSSSLRKFVFDQFSNSDFLGGDRMLSATNRFLELDERGRVPKEIVYRKLLHELGILNPQVSEFLFQDYEANAWRFARPFDGAIELLRWISDKGLKTGIISNGQTHIQLRSLLALNLDRIVDIYLISEQEGCRKPEGKIFESMTEKLGVCANKCVFVGDSPESDIQGARNAGMKTIWIPNGAKWPNTYNWSPDATLKTIDEVQAVIQDWSGLDAS